MKNNIGTNENMHIKNNAEMKNRAIAEVNRIKFSAAALVPYRALKNDGLIRDLYQLFDLLSFENLDIFSIIDLYSSIGHRLIGAAAGLREYFIEKMLFTENPFNRAAEVNGAGCLTGAMESAVKSDLAHLQRLASLRSEWIRDIISYFCSDDTVMREAVQKLPLWADMAGMTSEQSCTLKIKKLLMNSCNWPDCAVELADYHMKYGSGIFAKYRAFVWRHDSLYGRCEMDQMGGNDLITGAGSGSEQSPNNGRGLVGVESPDPVRFSDLVSYELERKDVIENTLHFLDGHPANNILLYGDRGTGKSTTVKALLNEYHDRGLRMIEVPKKLLGDFPLIIRQLAGRNLKFILFVDDLAFEDNEENYTALKAALEGGVESRPDNVLIYATSNRKHLIKERFSDRTGLISGNADDEVRAADTMQEKLSLSDRFGMTVIFSSPDKRRYLEIVEGLVKARGFAVDKDYLHREALKWELEYNGRSPRTARQFVDWLEGQIASDS